MLCLIWENANDCYSSLSYVVTLMTGRAGRLLRS